MPTTAPTLISYTETVWTTVTSPKTVSISWQTGDVIVYLAGAENATAGILITPTATGLTFSRVKESPANGVANANLCGTLLAAATAGASGSSVTVSGTITAGGGANWGFGVWVYRGSAGIGTSAEQETATKTKSLTTSAHSAVVWGSIDWGAGASPVASPTPTNTDEATQFGSNYSVLIADITDQSAGSVAYGQTGGSASGPFSIVVVEILGTTTSGGVQSTQTTPYIGLWSKDGVLYTGAFDVGIPIQFGLFDDGFVAQFSGTTVGATATGVHSVAAGLFDRDTTLIGLYGAN